MSGMYFKLLLALLLVFGPALLVDAQSTTPIEIDSTTHQVKTAIPFDQPFTLKYYATEKPAGVNYIQLKRSQTWFQTINYYTANRVLGVFRLSEYRYQQLRDVQVRESNAKIKTGQLQEQIKKSHDQLEIARLNGQINAELSSKDSDITALNTAYEHKIPILNIKHPLPLDNNLKITYGFLPISSGTYDLKEIPVSSITADNDTKTKAVYINFGGVIKRPDDYRISSYNYLKPGKNYAILITKFDDQCLNIFQTYHDDAALSITHHEFTRGDKMLNDYYTKQYKQYDLNMFYVDPDNAHLLYNTYLKANYDTLAVLATKFIPQAADIARINGFKDSKLLASVLLKYTSPSRKIGLPSKFLDSLAMLSGLENLIHINIVETVSQSAPAQHLLKGECSLKDTASVKKIKVADQLKQLQASLTLIQQIGIYTDLLLQHGEINDALGEEPELQLIIRKFRTQLDNLQAQQARLQKIKDNIAKQHHFLNIALVPGTTEVYDFQARSKFQVIPDFGYIGYGFQKGFTSFAPYLGFQVNFRPINKDIPWGDYHNRTLWHYLSFSTGWTLTSLAKTGERENFFSGSSLMTGIGFRLTNAIKLNNGVVWFYEDNPNPVLTNRSLKCTFYTGISIDLDLKELMNDFIGQTPNLRQ